MFLVCIIVVSAALFGAWNNEWCMMLPWCISIFGYICHDNADTVLTKLVHFLDWKITHSLYPSTTRSLQGFASNLKQMAAIRMASKWDIKMKQVTGMDLNYNSLKRTSIPCILQDIYKWLELKMNLIINLHKSLKTDNHYLYKLNIKRISKRNSTSTAVLRVYWDVLQEEIQHTCAYAGIDLK